MATVRGQSLLIKYVVSFLGVVGFASVAYSVSSIWFAFAEHRAALAEIQQARAEAAASRIAHFVGEIESQLRWGTHLPWADQPLDSHRLDALRMLRQTSAVTDLALLDADGRERLFVSRLSMTRVETRTDHSAESTFMNARAKGVHYGPVYFRQETEPFMTLAVAGPRADAGVVVAEVNLKHIWDVVARIQVGQEGIAYVVDRQGRLIAHPDISLVLRSTNVSRHLQATQNDLPVMARGVSGLLGQAVLMASVVAAPLDWRVVVELPLTEADAPLRHAIVRSLWISAGSLLLALLFAVALSWRMLRPIRALTAGAARIGSGQLDHRISIRTGDEIETLGKQFNTMAGELGESYASLERKVEARTQELAEANRSKSRFLAAASHDLRQPLHALNLLVAQLGLEREPQKRERLTRRVEAAVEAINELFDGLLDISKLEAGVVTADVCDFPIQQLLDRAQATFAADAAGKGLRIAVARSRAWVRSDPRLLERVVGNLVGNAVRYTARGGIVVGCRRRDGHLWIEVCDTGVGIAADKHREIFNEFYQVTPPGTLRGEGLGLGLAIVARLCELLDHPVRIASVPGRGSCFGIRLPVAAPQQSLAPAEAIDDLYVDPLRGKRVVVLDDDEGVLESTAGLLSAWGCHVVSAASVEQAFEQLGDTAPDLVIADFHLGESGDGTAGIELLRQRYGPSVAALLVSGDVGRVVRERAASSGLQLLDKPVPPMRLRAVASRLVSQT